MARLVYLTIFLCFASLSLGLLVTTKPCNKCSDYSTSPYGGNPTTFYNACGDATCCFQNPAGTTPATVWSGYICNQRCEDLRVNPNCCGGVTPCNTTDCCGTGCKQTTDLCCGNKGYNPELGKGCCAGTVYDTLQGTAQCCGSTVIDSRQQQCCSHTVFNPSTQQCCGGQVISTANGQACCAGKLVYTPAANGGLPTGTSQCCNATSIYVGPYCSYYTSAGWGYNTSICTQYCPTVYRNGTTQQNIPGCPSGTCTCKCPDEGNATRCVTMSGTSACGSLSCNWKCPIFRPAKCMSVPPISCSANQTMYTACGNCGAGDKCLTGTEKTIACPLLGRKRFFEKYAEDS